MAANALAAPTDVRLMYVMTSAVSAWTLLRGELAYMRARGLSPIIACAPGKLLEQTTVVANVNAAPVTMAREPSPTADCAAVFHLYRAMRRLRPHIVRYSTPKAALLASLAACLARVPIRLYIMRGLRAEGCSGLRRRLLLYPERIACRLAHRVYCVSPSLRDQALRWRLAAPEKVRVLANGSSHGVDADHFSRSPEVCAAAACLREQVGLPVGVPVVAFAGRVVRDKGVVELIEAFHRLAERFPQLHLLVIGPHESGDVVPADCRRTIDSHSQIVVTGHCDDMAAAYALADLVVLPSYREGFPNVVLEAAAMELPVVTTHATGCRDSVVNGVTGTLVPPRDAAALADAIGRYLADGELRRRHGAAGRARVVRDFQPHAIWGSLYDEYQELLVAKGFLSAMGSGMPGNDGRRPDTAPWAG